MVSMMINAVLEHSRGRSEHPNIANVHVCFLAPVREGRMEIKLDVLRYGKNSSSLMASVFQMDELKVSALVK